MGTRCWRRCTTHPVVMPFSHQLICWISMLLACNPQNGMLKPVCHHPHPQHGTSGQRQQAACWELLVQPGLSPWMPSAVQSAGRRAGAHPAPLGPKPSTALPENNQARTHTVRVRLIHLPASQPWLLVTSPAPEGQAQPFLFQTTTDYLLQSPISHRSRNSPEKGRIWGAVVRTFHGEI